MERFPIQWSWDINPWLWTGLLVGYYIYDTLCAKYVVYAQKLKSIHTANTSLAILLLGIASTFVALENLANIIPMGIGCWLGTFIAIELEIKIKNKNEKRRSNSKNVGQNWVFCKFTELWDLLTRKFREVGKGR